MKTRKIILIQIAIISIIILSITVPFGNQDKTPKEVYQVYLDGNAIGLVKDKDDLLNLINEKQDEIKTKFSVDSVYPPNGFEIKEYITYNEKIESPEKIYNLIKKRGDFTIKATTVTINKPIENDQGTEKKYIYVKNEEIFKEAQKKMVTAFVSEDEFNNYNNKTQGEIEDVGEKINHMYFEEEFTFKESFVSVNEKIYDNVSELTQYLMFGDEPATSYKVQQGDTINSIAEKNKLNTNEFLIANPKYKSTNNILAVDDEVSINLIKPIITLIQEMTVVEDVEQIYEKKTVIDTNKAANYKEITQQGVTGLNRMTEEVKITNGQASQGIIITKNIVIRDKVDEITTVGKSSSNTIIDTGMNWKWPTNSNYYITSEYQYREGSFHYALDISGTGFNSPIYAAGDGVVVEAVNNCANYGSYGNSCGGTYGNHIILRHANDYYTLYAHLTKDLLVSVGQEVTAGQQIARMGSSGSSTGTHLHFGTSKGYPGPSKNWFNPWSLFR